MSVTKRVAQVRDLRNNRLPLSAVSKLSAAPSTAKSYETILGRLGMTILQEQVPELLDYLTGFQLLDKSDDGDFAAGFFIFDVNGMLVDCPIFLVDGKVKGYQLMFLRKQNLFLPAKSEVIKYIMSRNTQSMGEASFAESDARPNRATINFDVYNSRNRYLQKVGSYPSFYDAWSRQSGALESFFSILESDEAAAIKRAAVERKAVPAPDWISLLEDRRAAGQVIRWSASHPAFAAKMASLLGTGWQTQVTEYLKTRDQYIAKQASVRLDDEQLLRVGRSAPRSSKLAAFSSIDNLPDGPFRQQLVDEFMNVGAVFFDERPIETLKTAMLIEPDESWVGPFASGMYDVPLLDGTTRRVRVFLPKDVINLSYGDGSALVLDLETKQLASVRVADLATSATETTQSIEDASGGVEKLHALPKFNPDSFSENDIVMVFDHHGNASSPFKIRGGSSEGGWEISDASLSPQGRAEPYGDILGAAVSPRSPGRRARMLYLRGKDKDCLTVSEFADDVFLVVPPDATCAKLAVETHPEDCCDDRVDLETFRIMPLSELALGNLQKQATFDVQHVAADVLRYCGQSMRRRDVAAWLMTAGMSKQAAIEVVTKAGPDRQYYAVVPGGVEFSPWQLAATRKVAFDRMEMQGDKDFRFRDPSPGQQGMSTGQFRVPEQSPVSEHIRTDGFRYADQSRPPWSSEYDAYAQPQQFGGDGSGSGGPPDASEQGAAVFENSLFSSLVAHVDPSTDRERLLSGLVQCCNDTGRTLFLNYAHGDEFADAYGMSDAAELEEQLMRVFEGAGKLMVLLFNRALQSGHDLSLGSILDS